MWGQISEIFRRAAIRTADNVANFLPGLIVLLVILLGAFLVALSVRMILLRILRGVEFDRRAQQMGLAVLSDRSPTAGPSVLVGRTVMWVILVLGLLVGISALDATMPAQFAMSVFQYVPNVLAALAILIGGHLISRFLARSVLIAAVNLQMQSARLLSAGVKWLVLVLAWAMALEHLGIGGRILTLAFGILFGGIVLALAIAVGLGSKEMVTRSLERQLREPGERPDKLTHV
jgi:Mechanosensitive ion channel, conserved TM helix